MKKEKNYYLIKWAGLLFVALAILIGFSTDARANQTYISQVTIKAGANAKENLEKSGYTVLFQGMNLVSDPSDGSMVYLGYKKGTSGITDLLISSKKQSSLTYQGSTYKLVSPVSLNKGTGASAIYLYWTKSARAGEPILTLDTEAGFSSKDKVLALKNDGSVPVRTEEGKLANLDQGLSGHQLYLRMYKDDGVKRYISDAAIVSASTKAQAISLAVSKGFDYYLETDLSSNKSKVTYLAYQRSDDKSKAINKIKLKDGKIKITREESLGSYLIDLSSGQMFDDDFQLGQWAGVYAAFHKNISKTSKAYKSLEKSKDKCTCVSAGEKKLYASYLGKIKESKKEEAASQEKDRKDDTESTSETVKETEKENEIEPTKEETDTPEETLEEDGSQEQETAEESEEVTDEFYDLDKSETEEETEQNQEEEEVLNDKTASIFSSGNIKIIILFLALILIVIVGITTYKKGKKKNEKIN